MTAITDYQQAAYRVVRERDREAPSWRVLEAERKLRLARNELGAVPAEELRDAHLLAESIADWRWSL